MKKIKFLLILLSIPGLLMISCSKDDEMEDEPEYFLPSSAERSVIVEAPSGLKALADDGDMYALSAISYMGLVNVIAGFSGSFMIPSDAKPQSKGDSKVYYWSYGGYSYWMTYSTLTDKYTWKYEYEFPDIPRFTYIYAEEAKSGNSGFWHIISPNDPDLKIWNYVWSITPLNGFQATIKLNDKGTSNEGEFNVVTKEDKSGSYKYDIGNQTQAHVIWNANGSGTYLVWDGNEEKTGFWD